MMGYPYVRAYVWATADRASIFVGYTVGNAREYVPVSSTVDFTVLPRRSRIRHRPLTQREVTLA